MVAIRVPGREARGHARAQDLLAGTRHEGQLAFHHVDQLVLVAVPVALRGPATGRQLDQIDPELGQPGGIAERALDTRCDG